MTGETTMSQDDASPDAGGQNKPAAGDETIPKAEVDRIVMDRLARDRRVREEELAKEFGVSIKEAIKLTKAAKERADADKSEAQIERERREAAERERDAIKLERDLEKWRAKYGREAGIPEADWDRLRGTTEDEIAEDAKEWAKSRGLNKAGGPTPPGGSAPTGNEFNRMVLQAAGRGGR